MERAHMLDVFLLVQVLQPMAGYCSPVWKQVLYLATVLCTLGMSWMFATLLPAVMILLRLRPCSVQSASFVTVQVGCRTRNVAQEEVSTTSSQC